MAASADGEKLEDKLTDQASQAGQLWYPHAQTLDKGSDSRKTDRLLTKEHILFFTGEYKCLITHPKTIVGQKKLNKGTYLKNVSL